MGADDRAESVTSPRPTPGTRRPGARKQPGARKIQTWFISWINWHQAWLWSQLTTASLPSPGELVSHQWFLVKFILWWNGRHRDSSSSVFPDTVWVELGNKCVCVTGAPCPIEDLCVLSQSLLCFVFKSLSLNVFYMTSQLLCADFIRGWFEPRATLYFHPAFLH